MSVENPTKGAGLLVPSAKTANRDTPTSWYLDKWHPTLAEVDDVCAVKVPRQENPFICCTYGDFYWIERSDIGFMGIGGERKKGL